MLKRIVIISILALTVVVFISIVLNMSNTNKKEEILTKENHALLGYTNAKATAENVKTLISIKNESDYISSKQSFKNILSKDLYDEYFSTEKYEGGEKTFYVTEQEIVGEIISDDTFVYKMHLSLVEEYGETPVVLLVYIKNNIIYRIQSMG